WRRQLTESQAAFGSRFDPRAHRQYKNYREDELCQSQVGKKAKGENKQAGDDLDGKRTMWVGGKRCVANRPTQAQSNAQPHQNKNREALEHIRDKAGWWFRFERFGCARVALCPWHGGSN